MSSPEDKYNEVEGDIFIKKQPYLDIDHEELENFNFIQSEVLMINLNLLDLDFEGSDSVNNAPVVSTVIDKILLPN